MNEQNLMKHMHRATDTLQPPSDLVARSITRGKQIRRRQRVQTALAAAAVVGVVGVGALLVPGVMQDSEGGRKAPPIAEAPPVDRTETVAKVTIPPGQMAATLAGVLPEGPKTNPENWSGGGPLVLGAKESSFQGGSVVYDDGEGPGKVQAQIRVSQQADEEMVCASNSAFTCVDVPGGRLATLTNDPSPDDSPVLSTVQFISDSGFTVITSAYNAPSERDLKGTRPAPILSIEQLTALARNPIWIK